MKYLVLDLETGSDAVFGRVGNYKYNQIVCFSIKTDELEYDQYVRNQETTVDEIVSFIQDKDVLVAHNAKYELLYLYGNQEFQDWLKQGGKIHCTQLTEYFLSSFQEKYPKLRDIAVQKYGLPYRERGIDEYFQKGIRTEDIPEEIVIEDNTNDTADTTFIYLRQLRMIQDRGEVFKNLLKVQNDFLLATTDLEYNGVYINQQVLQENEQELELELLEAEKDLEDIIKRFWK